MQAYFPLIFCKIKTKDKKTTEISKKFVQQKTTEIIDKQQQIVYYYIDKYKSDILLYANGYLCAERILKTYESRKILTKGAQKNDK